jgi:hypothetical protein
MPLQSNVNVSVRYAPETTFGTAGTSAQALRRVSSSLNLTKDAFTSNEVRTDQQVFDVRHGVRRVAGGIQGELSTATWDAFIEASLRGTWAAGGTGGNANLTSLSVSGSAFVAGGGSFITQGFKIGDVVRLSGFSHANVGRNFRITALTATNMAVFPAPAAMTSQTTFTIAIAGRKLTTGTQRRSFTIEQNYPDSDFSELFLGCRVASMSMGLPPTGMATVGFDFQGQDGQNLAAPNAPFFASPATETTTGILAGLNGSLLIDGAASAIVTGLDFQVQNNLSSQPVVGSQIVPEIFYGRTVVTGNVSVFLENENFMNVFLNEEEIDIVAQLDAAGSTDFMCVSMSRVKFTGASKTVGPDGGVIVQFPFQSLLRSGSTTLDSGSLVIQRSNAT